MKNANNGLVVDRKDTEFKADIYTHTHTRNPIHLRTTKSNNMDSLEGKNHLKPVERSEDLNRLVCARGEATTEFTHTHNHLKEPKDIKQRIARICSLPKPILETSMALNAFHLSRGQVVDIDTIKGKELTTEGGEKVVGTEATQAKKERKRYKHNFYLQSQSSSLYFNSLFLLKHKNPSQKNIIFLKKRGINISNPEQTFICCHILFFGLISASTEFPCRTTVGLSQYQQPLGFLLFFNQTILFHL
ncbi:hypothetical protein E2320_013564 [Naja naja]|nr:hypothetical protein E2320_013564 [Naja naja]